MSAPNVMTPEHTQWKVFAERMCRLRFGACTHRYDHTIECLNQFPGVDIQASVLWLRENGGYCDCEVILNVIVA